VKLQLGFKELRSRLPRIYRLLKQNTKFQNAEQHYHYKEGRLAEYVYMFNFYATENAKYMKYGLN